MLYICKNCSHKLFMALRVARFCRECGSDELRSVAFADWIILGLVALLLILSFTSII